MLKRGGLISGWHDRRISAGTEWKTSIDNHIESAEVILLLISVYFLASDYSYDIELKRAMERHEKGEARVIPVILRHCDWSSAPFAKLQSLPKDAKPTTSWADRDEAFTDVAAGIKRVITELNRLNAAFTKVEGTTGKHATADEAPLPKVQYVAEITAVKLHYLVNGEEYIANENEMLTADFN